MNQVSFTATPIRSTEDPEAAFYRVRVASTSNPPFGLGGETARTGLLSEALSRMTAFMLPISLAASFFAPDIDVSRRIRVQSSTPALVSYIGDLQGEDTWEIVLEPVTLAEIEQLKQIWALPYPGPVSFEVHDED